MKTRNIAQAFATEHNLGFKNLYVSGCSFTYNNSNDQLVTWPYYLRDLGHFDQVVDSSMPGAGNYHIANSLIWTLEQYKPDPGNTLVAVMWSGVDRDDSIISREFIDDYPFEFEYAPGVVAGISGGLDSDGNHKECHNFSKSKNSRGVENFLYYTTTYHYLKSNGYSFVFLKYLDPEMPSRTCDFSIEYNTSHLFDNVQTIYEYAVRADALEPDDFHPNPNGHLGWTREILLPYLVDKFK